MTPLAIIVSIGIAIAVVLLFLGLLAIRRASPLDPAWAEEPLPAFLTRAPTDEQHSQEQGAPEGAWLGDRFGIETTHDGGVH